MPIEIYTGPQGYGKTYCMVKEAILPALADPRWEVLSNLDVVHPTTKRRTVNITLPPEFRQADFDMLASIIDANLAVDEEHRKSLLIALDEMSMVAPPELARSSNVLNVVAMVLQLRKARCDFVGTVQTFDRMLKVVRDNTSTVHVITRVARTWKFWRRDDRGTLNRKTGRYHRMPWFFEIESLPPDYVHLVEGSALRVKKRQGVPRKVRFDAVTGAAYDTYQRQSASAIGAESAPSIEEIEDVAEAAAAGATRRTLAAAGGDGSLILLPAGGKGRASKKARR